MKKFLQFLFQIQRQNAEAKQIAKHLSRVLLYELKGKDTLYPDLKEGFEKLEKRMEQLNKPIFLVEAFRSAKKQNDYYKKIPKITNAKGLQSYHQYGLAFDVAFKKYKWSPPGWHWWVTLGDEGKKLGLIWGGEFKDYGHFELHQNFTWKNLINYFQRSAN